MSKLGNLDNFIHQHSGFWPLPFPRFSRQGLPKSRNFLFDDQNSQGC